MIYVLQFFTLKLATAKNVVNRVNESDNNAINKSETSYTSKLSSLFSNCAKTININNNNNVVDET